MKLIIFMWLLSGLGACVAWGQRPQSSTTRARAIPSRAQANAENTSITFLTSPNGSPVHSLGADQSVLNLGSLSYATPAQVDHEETQRQKNSFVVSTRFGLRIGLPSAHPAGTATVSAYLLNANPLQTVWVDGVRLSMTPRIIGRQVSYGVVTEHVLKIEIPVSMPAGQISDSIRVIYTPN